MWFTALVIGFAGSMHCVGMCSPLVMAVSHVRPSAMINRLLYNGGRITMYASMGALVSGAGMMLPIHQFQNLFSIGLGFILLIAGFGGLQNINIPVLSAVLRRLTGSLKTLFARHLKQKGRVSIVMLGALNGLLPCGLTFIALTSCLTLKGPMDGFNFMLLFGAGTLPAMMGFAGIIHWAVKRYHWNLQKVTTTLLILSGCALIIRVFVIHIPHASSLSEGILEILCR